MDLRTGKSVWNSADVDAPPACPLSRDERCDVLVVGSGITGAMSAFALAKAGLDVVVIDRRKLSQGSTPASTGLLQYEIDSALTDLTQRLGRQRAQAAYRICRQLLDDMVELVDQLSDPCELHSRPSLFLAREEKDIRDLQVECAARRDIGLEVELLDRAALLDRYQLHAPAAIRSAFALEVNPIKLTSALLQAAVARGVRLYDQTTLGPACAINNCTGALVANGHSIGTGHVLLATGYETPEEFAFVRKLCQIRNTYAMATAPLPESFHWPERALVWEYGDPYLYARSSAENRLMVGGEDDNDGPEEREERIVSKSIRLEEKWRRIHPTAALPIEYRWAGAFAVTEDGLPFIGSPVQHDRVLFALGYGGNGITFSLLASQILRDQLLGQAHSSAELFSFQRVK